MGLNKSKGNMYDFVTHCHSHLGGKCPHKCSYCYVQKNRFGVPDRYKGEPRLIEKELLVNYGSGKTIFIEHMNDLFADGIDRRWIELILERCKKYPNNQYVFQTKNPLTAFENWRDELPGNYIFGTTIESDSSYSGMTNAPHPIDRRDGIKKFSLTKTKTFITIEPICDLDVDVMIKWMKEINPFFINIGADSKGCNLPEPSPEKVRALIEGLQKAGLVIKKKSNLGRLLFNNTLT